MENQNLPARKDELIERIRSARLALDQTIRGLSPEFLARPGPDGGWSVQDHLAHLTEWRWKLLAMVEGRPAHEGLKIDPQTYASAGLDGINALLYERNRHRSTPQILADYDRSHQAVLAAVDRLAEADLRRAYDLTDPTDSRLLVEGIAGNTYLHDLEHAEYIRRMIAE